MLVTVKEAAKRLGVSPSTIRSRIKSGKLAAQWPEANRVLVELPGPPKAKLVTRLRY